MYISQCLRLPCRQTWIWIFNLYSQCNDKMDLNLLVFMIRCSHSLTKKCSVNGPSNFNSRWCSCCRNNGKSCAAQIGHLALYETRNTQRYHKPSSVVSLMGFGVPWGDLFLRNFKKLSFDGIFWYSACMPTWHNHNRDVWHAYPNNKIDD